MFTVKQTRQIFLLVILITIMISFIGRNWNSGIKDRIKTKARLDIPDAAVAFKPEAPVKKTVSTHAPVSVKETVVSVAGTSSSKKKQKKVSGKYSGALKDEGKEIIFE
jgi:hypothetical protein